MQKKNPLKIQGERNLDCEFYDYCLDIAAKKNWKYLTCERCDFFKSAEAVQIDNRSPKSLTEPSKVNLNGLGKGEKDQAKMAGKSVKILIDIEATEDILKIKKIAAFEKQPLDIIVKKLLSFGVRTAYPYYLIDQQRREYPLKKGDGVVKGKAGPAHKPATHDSSDRVAP